jgi:hypothetical protein
VPKFHWPIGDLKENTWENIKWICLVLFVIMTFVFILFLTRWDVSSSQHVWCQVIDTISKAPAPTGNPANNPSRAYEQQLAKEFITLKGSLGC